MGPVSVTCDCFRGEWRPHLARVEAFPPDYQIVCKEMQEYFFTVGPIDVVDGPLLPGIIDFLRGGRRCRQGSPGTPRLRGGCLCDGLIEDSLTYADIYQQSISGERGAAEK